MNKTQPSKTYKVVAKETVGWLVEGSTYEVIQNKKYENMWSHIGKETEGGWFKHRFSEPLTEEAPKKLENVFIRVNGEAEKEAAIELLGCMGYKPPTGLNSGSTILGFVGYSDGDLTTLLTPFWSSRVHKELKVNKQVIPAKVVFTLAKEKTYNIDGKELTRDEVEGMIAEMDKNIVEIGFKSNLLYRLLQGE
jgi:hypothetical protein